MSGHVQAFLSAFAVLSLLGSCCADPDQVALGTGSYRLGPSTEWEGDGVVSVSDDGSVVVEYGAGGRRWRVRYHIVAREGSDAPVTFQARAQ